jgi:DNA-binding GntR family transcriptional regulator
MTSQSNKRPAQKLYEVVYGVLRRNIEEANLPQGLVLLEGPIAEIFDLSRAPVQRALQLLEADGLVRRFEGRGYLAGGAAKPDAPLRHDIREVGLTLPGDIAETLQARSSWERIYHEVELEVASCLAFGRYRIIEVNIAEHYGVSRTVIRDVLARLQERGLVKKNQKSHWVAGPLTAKSMRDHYEIRRLLEPPALLVAAENFDTDELIRMRDRVIAAAQAYDRITSEEIHRIEDDLHGKLVLTIDNPHLASHIRQSQLPLLTNQLFERYLGMPEHSRMLSEHRLVLEHLVQGARAAAAAALEAHLKAALVRSLARLKTLSVFPEPDVIPAYLVRATWADSAD